MSGNAIKKAFYMAGVETGKSKYLFMQKAIEVDVNVNVTLQLSPREIRWNL